MRSGFSFVLRVLVILACAEDAFSCKSARDMTRFLRVIPVDFPIAKRQCTLDVPRCYVISVRYFFILLFVDAFPIFIHGGIDLCSSLARWLSIGCTLHN